MDGKSPQGVIEYGTCFWGGKRNVHGISQFVCHAQGLAIKGCPVRVIHALLCIFQHIAIGCKGAFYLVV